MTEEMKFEVIDRYTCLGIPHPDPETMCKGHCEGTGYVPIFIGDSEYMESETDPVFIALWEEAEEKEHAKDGWHFVLCPRCKGSRLEPNESDGER